MLTALVGIWAKVSPKQRLGFLVGLIVIAFVVWLVGCSTGYTRTTLPNGTKVEVKQSPNSVAPAWIKLKWLGHLVKPTPQASPPSAQSQPSDMLDLETSTGNDQQHNLVAEAQGRTLTWIGVALLVLGGIGWIAKAWLPVIPVSACIVAASLGLALLALPHLFASPVFLWGSLGVIGLVAFIGWRDNHKNLTTASDTGAASSSA